jgi:hypothetical protein
MIATWPQCTWHERERSEPSELGRMLGLLAHLGDPVLVERMIDVLVNQQGHDKSDNATLLKAVALFPTDRAAELLQKIVAANAVNALGSCGALLAGALIGVFAKTLKQLHDVAKTLLDQLPGDPASAPQDQWGRPRGAKPNAAFVVDLVDVVDRIDVGLAKKAANHVLAWPRHFGLDRVLVPGAKRLIQSKRRSGPAFDAVYTAVIAHLETRVAEPLEAPLDWTRPSNIRCRCQHCAELSEFLTDSARENWTLRAAQQFRTHVEDEFRRASADVDTETLRSGIDAQPDLPKEPGELQAARRATQTGPRRPPGIAPIAAFCVQRRDG